MEEMVVRVSIETKDFFNSGFIHIADDVIEGLFTCDYVSISLDGQNLILYLVERDISLIPFIDKKEALFISLYCEPCPDKTLSLLNSYTLRSPTGDILTLDLGLPVKDSNLISLILNEINRIRE